MNMWITEAEGDDGFVYLKYSIFMLDTGVNVLRTKLSNEKKYFGLPNNVLKEYLNMNSEITPLHPFLWKYKDKKKGDYLFRLPTVIHILFIIIQYILY